MKKWPHFHWDTNSLAKLLAEVRFLQGNLLGQMNALGFQLQDQARLQALTLDVIKTSEIEGEKLNDNQVRSSIARHLGIDIAAALPADRNVEGIVEITLDATINFNKPLTKERLFGWHAALFPTGRSGFQKITVGAWRNSKGGPMQIVSGAYGREKIHFEAPSYDKIKKEMSVFLKWFESQFESDLILKAAIAHFWFVTIHPFDDGNGRIARAISDSVLAKSENSKMRFYSMSSQIQKERKQYYDILEICQRGDLDITIWLEWFLGCLKRAIESSQFTLENILIKAKFWKNNSIENFNARQQQIINRLFDGFEGKLTSSKWAKLTKCSQDTALRDIQDLVNRKILTKDEAGGRSTSYNLNLKKRNSNYDR